MTVLLWWSLASIGVSLFVGAFMAYGRREPDRLDLDVLSAQRAARSAAAAATPQPAQPVDSPDLT